jgi:hypothetical protein
MFALLPHWAGGIVNDGWNLIEKAGREKMTAINSGDVA